MWQTKVQIDIAIKVKIQFEINSLDIRKSLKPVKKWILYLLFEFGDFVQFPVKRTLSISNKSMEIDNMLSYDRIKQAEPITCPAFKYWVRQVQLNSFKSNSIKNRNKSNAAVLNGAIIDHIYSAKSVQLSKPKGSKCDSEAKLIFV